MRFGFTLPNNFGVTDALGMIDLAAIAEELGYDSVWVNHHVLNVGYVHDRLGNKPYHDAMTTLTYAAAHTERIRLGTSVMVLPYLHPMSFAKTVATLDVLSGGRVDLGVGVGGLEAENVALGSDFATRGAYTDESLDVMIELWTEEHPSYSGEHFSFDGVQASPKPQQLPHVPLIIGGNSAPALRRVARVGQGWHPLASSPDGMKRRLETLDAELEKVGRSRSEISVSLRTTIDDVAEVDDRPGSFTGPPEQWLRSIAAYEEAGATEIVVSLMTGDLDHIRYVLTRFAEVAING